MGFCECVKSSTKSLFCIVILFSTIAIYIMFMFIAYNNSVESSDFLSDSAFQKTLLQEKSLNTFDRFNNHEKSIKEWIQHVPQDLLDQKKNQQNLKADTKFDAAADEKYEAITTENARFSSNKSESKVTSINSIGVRTETSYLSKSDRLQDKVLQDLNFMNIRNALALDDAAGPSFSMDFGNNIDFGSGSYKAYWIRAEGNFTQRILAYNKAIHKLRKKLLSERKTQEWKPPHERIESLWCNRDDFMKELEKYPQVKTVALSWQAHSDIETWDSRNDSENILVRNYYKWTGSDNLCNMINTPGFTKARWDAVYNSSCSQFANTSSQNKKLETLYLHGKPINKNHYWPNHGSKYPEYFYKLPPRQVFYMHIVEDVVITSLGDIISGNLKLIPYSCSQDLSPMPPPNHEKSPVYEEVFVMGQYWGSSFFHLMLENVPRIAPYLDFLYANPNISIHVQSTEGLTSRLLDILKIEQSRLIQGTVRAMRVYLPQATPCGFAHLQSVQLLSNFYHNYLQTIQKHTERKSILLVRRSGSRRFTQHLKILKALEDLSKEYNLEFKLFIDNPSPSMQDAMLMFKNAILVVAPHGAGLSNIVFCERGTLVIEGVCNPPHVNMCYQWTAHVLGLRYHGIASRGGCETWVDVDHLSVSEAARKLLNDKLTMKL